MARMSIAEAADVFRHYLELANKPLTAEAKAELRDAANAFADNDPTAEGAAFRAARDFSLPDRPVAGPSEARRDTE